ncbi:hypothetical protein [Bartonella sp. HY406]|uniref:hypothetical protein n=1 Tax=Bartonella sp. HY406 TaxID=2979331 RepID=UPI0021C6CB1D|nr:hypothetical protein [Bartonella sp. HY406]UXN03948.1 hypothetical protein N6B01_02600 [Bartonella sp. HY406]
MYPQKESNLINRYFTQQDILENNVTVEIFEYYAKTEDLNYVDVIKIFIKILENLTNQVNHDFFKYIEYAKEFYYGPHVGDEKFLEEKRVSLWKKMGKDPNSQLYKEGRPIIYPLFSEKVAIEMKGEELYMLIPCFIFDLLNLNLNNWQYIEPCVAEYYGEISKA